MNKKRKTYRARRILYIGILLGVLISTTMIGSTSLRSVIDFPSLVIVILIPCSVLSFADQWPDYLRAISIAMGNTEFTSKEYKASRNALRLSIRLFWMSGIIGTLIGFVLILSNLDSINSVGQSMAIGSLTLLYSMVFNMLHYGIFAKVEKELIYREHTS